MNKRNLREFAIRIILLACAAWPRGAAADASASPKAEVTSDSRPNVLLIVSYDQRPDTIGVLGNPVIHTPALDLLVRQGLTFTRAVAPYPLCVPSRAEIMTGCDGFRNHVRVFGSSMNSDLIRWADCMRRAGYHAWYVGKWMNDGRPINRGYEESDGLFASGGRKWMKRQVDHHGRPVTGYRGWVFQDDEGNKFPEKVWD
ncbi:MAG: sulfatase family protein [Planctomycetota bacterium]|jgi:arylsulfatase A-like enzyme